MWLFCCSCYSRVEGVGTSLKWSSWFGMRTIIWLLTTIRVKNPTLNPDPKVWYGTCLLRVICETPVSCLLLCQSILSLFQGHPFSSFLGPPLSSILFSFDFRHCFSLILESLPPDAEMVWAFTVFMSHSAGVIFSEKLSCLQWLGPPDLSSKNYVCIFNSDVEQK